VRRVQLTRDDRIRLSLHGEAFALTRPVNDLMGLRDEPTYLEWLKRNWGDLAPSPALVKELLAGGGRARKRPDRHHHDRSFVATLGELAAQTSEPSVAGIDYEWLAPFLTQVLFHFGHREIEVPSLSVLAAWALDHHIHRALSHRDADYVAACDHCNRLWFGRPRADFRYCDRPAPGLTMTCAQLHAHERFARERVEWSKEYRKIMARKVRGTVSEGEFRLWKASCKPGERGKDWIPFDEWKAQKTAPKEVGNE